MDNSINASAVMAPKKKNKRSGASLIERRYRLGWVFISPFIIGLLLFYISIVANTVQFSFSTFHTHSIAQGGGYYLTWEGLNNFKYVLTEMTMSNADGESVTFLEVLGTSIASQAVNIVTILLLSLFVAVLLNQKMVGRAVFRAIFFVPVVVGAGIIAKIDASGTNTILENMMNGDTMDMGSVGGSAMSGLVSAMDVTALFTNLGIASSLVETVVGLVSDIYDIVNRSGVQMLIFLSGLQSISPAIYESASMEGATAWETFWKITFPMISPMILANAVYTVIDSFTAEDNILMVDILAIDNFATQSAASVLYFLAIAILLTLVALICSRFVFYQRRNE